MPNPTDPSFEVLNNYENNHCSMDVFFALSHGVHRGKLKVGKKDPRVFFIKNLIDICLNSDLEKFIFVSTCSNYGISQKKESLDEKSHLKPLSLYAKAKVDAEKHIISKKNILSKEDYANKIKNLSEKRSC